METIFGRLLFNPVHFEYSVLYQNWLQSTKFPDATFTSKSSLVP